MTTAQDGGKATGRIMSLKNSNDTIGNRTRDPPVCSALLDKSTKNTINCQTVLLVPYKAILMMFTAKGIETCW